MCQIFLNECVNTKHKISLIWPNGCSISSFAVCGWYFKFLNCLSFLCCKRHFVIVSLFLTASSNTDIFLLFFHCFWSCFCYFNIVVFSHDCFNCVSISFIKVKENVFNFENLFSTNSQRFYILLVIISYSWFKLKLQTFQYHFWSYTVIQKIFLWPITCILISKIGKFQDYYFFTFIGCKGIL